jgi:hypothetical protein
MKPALFSAVLIALTATACKKEKAIKVYRVAKTSPAAEQPKDPHAGITTQDMAMMGDSRGPKVDDQAPEGWTRQPANSMRQLSYRVKGEDGATADVSLVILTGSGAAKLPNVNRWRAQFDLPALDADSLGAHSETFTTSLGEALLVDIEGLPLGADGKKDDRMLGAIIDRGRDGWFFRMRGNAALTAAQKQVFLSWVKSVKPGEQPSGTTPDAAADKTPVESDEAQPPCCPTSAKKKIVTIPMNEALESYFMDHALSDDPAAPLFPGLCKRTPGGRNGLSLTFGRLMDSAGVSRKLIKQAADGAGRTQYVRSFHSLRHSFNTWMADAGVSQEDRMLLTGHTTKEVNDGYTHKGKESMRASISTLPTFGI